jgi:MerR family mercuric resistance operon transcriptional regulator
VRSKLDRLRRMESVLASVVSRCRGGRVPDCPVIDVLTEDLGRPGSLDSRPRLG